MSSSSWLKATKNSNHQLDNYCIIVISGIEAEVSRDSIVTQRIYTIQDLWVNPIQNKTKKNKTKGKVRLVIV